MKFYVLEHPKTAQSDTITDYFVVDVDKGEAPRCPVCGRFIGPLSLLPPLRVELKVWGQKFGDLAFGASHTVLVSERFKNQFQRSGLIGFSEFEPVKIVELLTRMPIKEPPPKYYAVDPMRSRAAIDSQASGIDWETRPSCEECRLGHLKRLRRLILEPGTWSGEDVFIARGLSSKIITSQRFKDFCDRHAFSNCVLTDADRYHFDFFPGERSGAAGA
jgi:Immunity protein family (Imm11)